MARIKYSHDFLKRSTLFYAVEEKHSHDGASSPLIAFLAQQGIDLVKDKEATDKAVAADDLFGNTSRLAEDHTQDRNNLFNPAFKELKNMIQYLKSLYVGNAKELGNWGVTVDLEHVVYPPDFVHRVELYKLVYAKHVEMGAGSPLLPFLANNDIDFDADKADVDAAALVHEKMEQAKRDAENHREERDLKFNPVMRHVRQIGGFLKALFTDNSKNLGDWGYTVDDSPRRPYIKKRIIKIGKPSTIKHVVIGSLFRNTGTTTLSIFSGNEVIGEGIVVNPTNKVIIPKGFDTITVINQSINKKGECTVKFG